MGFPKLDDVIQGVVAGVNETEPLAQAPDQVVGDQAPQVNHLEAQSEQVSSENPSPKPEMTPEEIKVLDLQELIKDKKFKFEDKEYTLDDLKKHMMRDADYRRKTQEIAAFKKEHESLKSDQKYWDNLQVDLNSVRQNPKLVSLFKSTYPEKFHSFIADIEGEEPSSQLNDHMIMSKVQQLLDNRINPLKESIEAREKEATLAQWQAFDTQFKSKYTLAQPEQVEALLQQALSNGTPPTKELWEQAYKLSHDKMDTLRKQWLSENIQQTKTINQKASDTKPGGSIAGQSPERVSLKDAGKKLAAAWGVEI